jgi:hypothetical protein
MTHLVFQEPGFSGSGSKIYRLSGASFASGLCFFRENQKRAAPSPHNGTKRPFFPNFQEISKAWHGLCIYIGVGGKKRNPDACQDRNPGAGM